MMLQVIKKEMPYIIMKKWFVCFLLFFISSCQSDDDTTLPPTEDSINGFWLSEELGYILEFTDGKDVVYNINSAGCAIADDDFELEDFVPNLVSGNELILTTDLNESDFEFTRLSNQNPTCLPDQIADTDDPKVNFDHFWNIFNDYYAFFEARNVDWSQYESLRDQVTTDNFYDILEELVVLLEDGHVSIIDDENGIEIDSGLPKLLEKFNENLSGDLIVENGDDVGELFNQKATTIVTEYLGGDFEIDERRNIVWGLINDTVGYVNILTMAGYGSDFSNEMSTLNLILDTMMNDISASGVSKLIIDIRLNGGGHDTAALDIVSRFMDQERFLYTKKFRLGDSFTEKRAVSVGPKGDFQFTGDIVLLTSPASISAADLFALCMKDLPYVTIVGENTAGALSNVLSHTLPNGAEIGLSNEVYEDPQGVIFEVVGIGPENQENQIPFLSTLDFQEKKDSGIERAIEILQQ
ncbi:S41 family peptidase [Aquimarina sp. MMG016]|uniref:S41 family peptidase n=1 Tax=Aquimarina sp. MMG016 TaxID=2822690 RepID=UPI001B3A7A9D|nr:S41 family peptidase [Aquimarina sp. MMG016]MBQ4820768.1 S41 family peptidase [Aquimarina sp. MMG016]